MSRSWSIGTERFYGALRQRDFKLMNLWVVIFQYVCGAVSHEKTKMESLYPLLVLVPHFAGAGLQILEDRYLHISTALEKGT